MTDPRDLNGGAEPNIKHEQEVHPPKRYDDPDAVAEEEKRYGMSMWVGTALIALIFVIIFLWIYLD
jgi:hypothetical protein